MPWLVVHSDCIMQWDDEDPEGITFVNVIPDFGMAHDLHPGCWCEPEEQADGLLVHGIGH